MEYTYGTVEITGNFHSANHRNKCETRRNSKCRERVANRSNKQRQKEETEGWIYKLKTVSSKNRKNDKFKTVTGKNGCGIGYTIWTSINKK